MIALIVLVVAVVSPLHLMIYKRKEGVRRKTKDGYLKFRLRPEAAAKAKWLQDEIPARYEAASGVRPPTPSVPAVMEMALSTLVGAHKGTLICMSAEKYAEETMTAAVAFAAATLKRVTGQDVQVAIGENGMVTFVVNGETATVDMKDRQLDMLQ